MRQYFSETRGLRKGYGVEELRIAVRDIYKDLKSKDHLQEWLGYECVDSGRVNGTGGEDPGRDIALEVGRSDIWPPDPVAGKWGEDAIFDFLQFIGDKVSSGIAEAGLYHSYGSCGWHYEDFKPEPARGEYLERVNKALARYGDGWEMLPGFDIVERAPAGSEDLLKVRLPEGVEAATRRRVHGAVAKYRNRTSSRDDRRDAVRDLGDVLESLRASAKKHLGKDEADLFNILNNFDIRHNNSTQKGGYDPIWLAGLFYHYLAMIHVLTHLIERDREIGDVAGSGSA